MTGVEGVAGVGGSIVCLVRKSEEEWDRFHNKRLDPRPRLQQSTSTFKLYLRDLACPIMHVMA